MDSHCHSLGVLALELAPGAAPMRRVLPAAGGDALASLFASDLARALPESDGLDVAIALAALDPAQLLRPGWPAHAALAELAARAPGTSGGRVLAFGAHDGTLPDAALQPDPVLGSGPLQLLPWLLRGGREVIAKAGAAMEERLLDTGMASAATALALQEAFGAPLEHVRLMSLHDLCALTAAQYGHAGLAPLWRVIEPALLAPQAEEFVFEDGPPLLYRDGAVALGTCDVDAWVDAGLAPGSVHDDPARLGRAFGYWQARERQFEAVLGAHGLPVRRVAIACAGDAREVLRSAMDDDGRTT